MSIFKKSEDYNDGSKGNDFLSVEDGSETNQNAINTFSPSNGDDQGANYDTSRANHPKTPYGEQGHYQPDGSASPSSSKDDNGGEAEMPYGQEAVDDNHADGGYNFVANQKSFLNLFKKAHDDEADFFTSDVSGGAADSPQKMDDGLPPEDYGWANQKPVVNNYVGQTDQSASELFDDPGVVNYKNPNQNAPELNKGRKASKNPYFFYHAGLKKKAYDELGNGSNVDSIMNPDEEENKHERSTHDFGDVGRVMPDQNQMIVNPLDQHLDLKEEQMYSGNANAHYNGFLNLFDKKGFYAGEMPSTNPNSGRDLEDDDKNRDFSGYTLTQNYPAVMSDGKNAEDSCNEADKIDNDPAKARKKIIYKNRVEDSDKQNYYQLLDSGGGYGMEGDGQNQSGVAN